MDVTVLTAFPGLFEGFLRDGLVGNALSRGLIKVEVQDLRQWGVGNYRAIDDYSFGGRGGMTLSAPVLDAGLSAVSRSGEVPYVIYPSPQGVPLTQDLVESLPRDRHVVFVCGHFEGLDERFVQSRVDLEISLGDFVLSGGEIPVMAAIDAMARLVEGAVGKELSVREDSFFDGMLDTCHYTRPASWNGQNVPEVLLSGRDRDIDLWRRRTAVRRTLARRPDLLSRAGLMGYLSDQVHLGLAVDPFDPALAETACQCLAVADAYGLDRVLMSPTRGSLDDLRAALEGAKSVKALPSPDGMVRWIARKGRGAPAVLLAQQENGLPWLEAKRRIAQAEGPVLVLLGAERFDSAASVPLKRIEATDRALPPVALVSAVLDRFFGSR